MENNDLNPELNETNQDKNEPVEKLPKAEDVTDDSQVVPKPKATKIAEEAKVIDPLVEPEVSEADEEQVKDVKSEIEETEVAVVADVKTEAVSPVKDATKEASSDEKTVDVKSEIEETEVAVVADVKTEAASPVEDATKESSSKDKAVGETSEVEETEVSVVADVKTEVVSPVDETTKEASSEDKALDGTSEVEETEVPVVAEGKAEGKSEASEKVESKAVEKVAILIDKIDHDALGKNELVSRLNYFLENIDISSNSLRNEVETIKNSFYKKHKREVQEVRERFLEEGGEEKDFRAVNDPEENLLKDLLNTFRSKRSSFQRDMESQKTNNLAEKYKIIEEIKMLQQGEESLNQTFKTFRDLQDRWRESGQVPQTNVKDLYETYHHNVERFYDYIKINKDLRDLDIKKNYEAKVKLCKRAEHLVALENVLDAFTELQELHLEWREVGPVGREEKEPLWQRFKEATAEINKKHQNYYEEIKKGQKDNLDKKTLLCEKVETIAEGVYDKPKAWNQQSDEILKIQNEWRSIGFAPKKYNTKIYERFRAACDSFFNKKRDYYQHYKDIQDDNYAKKEKLVELADSLKESTNWKKDSETLIRIQKEWKQIGPVPRKHSDAIWKRFREACDEFFNRKSSYFKNIDKVYDENLKLKKELIEEVKAFSVGEDDKAAILKFEEFKQSWNKIGHVPFKEKDGIYNEFKSALNAHYDNLHMDDMHKEVERYKSKIDDMQHAPNSYDKVTMERQRLFTKLKKLEGEIATLENNIGFFSSSSKSGPGTFLKEYERKIDEAKERAKTITQKIKLLDKA